MCYFFFLGAAFFGLSSFDSFSSFAEAVLAFGAAFFFAGAFFSALGFGSASTSSTTASSAVASSVSFPEVPVVPGVCMMQMVKELVEDFTGQRLRLSKADHLKFLTIINPRDNKLLHVDIAVSSNSVKAFLVTAAFFHEDTTFF